MTTRCRNPVVATAALLILLPAAELAGQVPPVQQPVTPVPPGMPPFPQPTYPGGGVLPGLQQPSAMPGVQGGGPTQQNPPPSGLPWDHPFNPAGTGMATFQGFPAFPPALAGYGGYPQVPRVLQQIPETGAAAAPPLLPGPPDWPSWVMVKSAERVPYAPDRAVLVRHADRVWVKVPEEDAFVPLYHFDKMRAILPGAEVEVQQSGEFQVLFHDGSRLYSVGPCRVKVAEMSPELLRLEFRTFVHLRIVCRGRPHEIALPDGTVVHVAQEPQGEGPVDLHVERMGGRASLFNAGRREAVLHTRFGERPLKSGFRAFVLLDPPGAAVPAELQHQGVELERRGPTLVCRGGEGGEVSWSGARFRLPAGATLVLDPLQGSPFDARDAGGKQP